MQLLLDLAAFLYIAGTVFVLVFALAFGLLLVIYLLQRNHVPLCPSVTEQDLCTVTVQLPIYNETHVVDRLLDACVALDYPAEKLHIQVLDDSSDETTALIQAKVCALHAQGFGNIEILHRDNRTGYKAGALAHGLAQSTAACVAIFDADFVPAPDFLRQTMPHFSANPKLGLIQTRWSHLNRETNLLTRAQALSIDAHFAIEQLARHRGNLPMSMNGTGAVWRAEAIHDAGGWSSATLTEDLDLSYRALMRGWEFLYLVDVVVPGELPPMVQAYKTQQARWATGSTQCLLRHTPLLLRSERYSTLKKLMGLVHLGQYVIQPVLLLLFLLAPILLLDGFFRHLPNMTFLSLVGIVPPLVIVAGQHALYQDWPLRLAAFPIQVMTAVAMVLSNSLAVLHALLAPGEAEFKRTPKFSLSGHDQRWQKSFYTLKADATILVEILLSLYAILGALIALGTFPTFVPYMVLYAVSFGGFAFWNIVQLRQSM